MSLFLMFSDLGGVITEIHSDVYICTELGSLLSLSRHNCRLRVQQRC